MLLRMFDEQSEVFKFYCLTLLFNLKIIASHKCGMKDSQTDVMNV